MPISIRARKGRSGTKWLSGDYARELHFATTIALTKTGVKVRDKVRDEARKVFTIRKRYTIRGIQIRGASVKDDRPVCVVYGGPEYLTIHAFGGRKRPRAGRQRIAVPTKQLRGSFSRPIPRSKTISRLARKRGTRPPFFIEFKRGAQSLVALVRRRPGNPPRRQRLDFLYVLPEVTRIQKVYEFFDVARRAALDAFPRELETQMQRSRRRLARNETRRIV